MFLAALDQTVMSTASLTISQHFNHVADQSWLLTTYIAASLLTTPIYGRLSDSYGRRRLFLIGLTLFALGSIFAAIAGNFDQIIIARAIQGLGAGGLFSLAFAVIADVLPVKERGRYVLLFVLIFGSASILGPVLGGVIASQTSILGLSGWRWIFIFNLPILLVALIQATKHLPSVSHKEVGAFDWSGTTFFGLSIFGALAIAQTSRSDYSTKTRGSFAILLILSLIAFLIAERRKGANAIFPLAFFKNRAFGLTVLTSAVSSAAMLIAMSISSLSIQIVGHRSPAIAGVVLLAMGVGNLFGSGYANRIFSREGSHRLLAAIGLLFVSAGFIPMVFSTKIDSIALGLFLLGIGSGLINQFTSVMAPSTVGTQNRGSASSINTLLRQLGGLFGVSAAMATIFYFWKVPIGFTVIGLSQFERNTFVDAVKPVYIATAIIVFLMALLARLMPSMEPTEEN